MGRRYDQSLVTCLPMWACLSVKPPALNGLRDKGLCPQAVQVRIRTSWEEAVFGHPQDLPHTLPDVGRCSIRADDK